MSSWIGRTLLMSAIGIGALAAAILPPFPLSRALTSGPSSTPEHTPHNVMPQELPRTEFSEPPEPRPDMEREFATKRAERAPKSRVCDTKLRLSATFYDTRRPERSYAVIGRPVPRSATLYRPGSVVSDYELARVHPRGVLLRRAESSCWLRIAPAARGSEAIAHPQVKSKRRSRARAAFSQSELDAGIQRVSATSFRVGRELLKQAMQRLPTLARSTRARYLQHDGRPVGVVLRRMARGGLLANVGLKRGDRVRTLNGLKLASAEGMLGARDLLSNANRLSLAIERGGKPLTLEYEIH